MARYRRRDAIETRLSDALEADGRTFTADLIAKRATGVEGYRLTLAFFEIDGPANAIVDLPSVGSRDDVQERAEALRSDPERLASLLAEHLSA